MIIKMKELENFHECLMGSNVNEQDRDGRVKGKSWLSPLSGSDVWENEKVLLAGYFFKNSKIFGLPLRRYFLLTKNHLLYKKSEESQKIKGFLHRRNLPVKFTTSNSKNGNFSIEFILKEKRVKIYTKDADVFGVWRKEITKSSIIVGSAKKDFNLTNKLLGKGGFAEVYECRSKETSETFAVKIIPKDILRESPNKLDHILNEVDALRGVDSENVVKLHYCYESRNFIYMILENLEGGSLRDILKNRFRLDMNDVHILMQKLISTLKIIHDQGFIHHDLKPDNIMLRKKDDLSSIVIIDFGLSKKSSDSNRKLSGTPGYMAPELWLNGKSSLPVTSKQNEAIDLFSIGVIYYYLITGEPLFRGNYSDILMKNKKCHIDFYNIRKRFQMKEFETYLLKGLLDSDPSKRVKLDTISNLNYPKYI